jgi:hypothetical protein
MVMIRRFLSVSITLFMILTATFSHARGFQVTPHVGYRFGGDFEDEETGEEIEFGDDASYGITLNIDYEENTELEFLYSYQETDLRQESFLGGESLFGLDVHYLHIGGTYFWDFEWAHPFVASTMGVTLLDPHPGGLDSEIGFSLSIGGGVKLYATDRFGLRLEGRGFGSFFDGGGAVFCGEGGCRAIIKSDVLLQFEFRAGVIVDF